MKMDRKLTKVSRLAETRCDDYVPGSPSSRIGLVWPLTKEVVSLSRNHNVKQRLQRHITVVHRGGL